MFNVLAGFVLKILLIILIFVLLMSIYLYLAREKYYFRRYLWNIVVWIDQGANVIIFLGDPDETLSSRAGKYARDKDIKWMQWIIDKMFGNGHCENAIEEDQGKDNVFRK